MHLPQELPKARVGADRIEEPVGLDRHHPLIALFDPPLEPIEGVVCFSEAEVNPGEAGRGHESDLGLAVKALQQLTRFSGLAGLRQRETQPSQVVRRVT